MSISEAIDHAKTTADYSRRRASAVKNHSKAVVTTGLEAAKHVAEVALQNLKASVETQVATLLDREQPVTRRVRKLAPNAIAAAHQARIEIVDAVREGFEAVIDKLTRVTDVTHKEQALENRIARKVKKARRHAADA